MFLKIDFKLKLKELIMIYQIQKFSNKKYI